MMGETPAAPDSSASSGPQSVYTGLTVEARRLADEGRWVFGVVMGGAFIALTDRKLGGVDDDLREAAQPGFKAARASAYERERLGLS